MALAYDRGARFSGGFGVGLYSIKGAQLPPLGIFGRLRLLRWEWGSLGVGVTLSRNVGYRQRFVGADWVNWSWIPAYRATGTLGAELARWGWSFRLDAGLGYLLRGPNCTATDTLGNTVSGDCDSSQFSAAVRNASESGRVIPSLTATIGYRFMVPTGASPAVADTAPDAKSPDKALHLSLWSTLVPVLAGTAMLGLGMDHDRNVPLAIAGATTLALGISFGPSIGFAYSDESLRAWGVGALRLAGIVLGTAEFIWGGQVSEQTSKNDPALRRSGPV
jgi:hypothetical protein